MKAALHENLKTDLMTDTERQRLESYSAKKSTLLVVGQTNSGKSSFVNELLGGSFMPTSEVPCTSRIVRLKYSRENYVQVLDESRPSEDKHFFSKKKLPKEAIELDESRRGDPSWINAVVEVGLNNSLLQNGHLEVIDAPGMSENEALDKVVDECIHGALQVIIYVVDGNSSLRLQERGFLLKLKEKVGNLPIFYLCNKVDKDKTAQEFDRDSDSEDDEEPSPSSGEEKEQLVYQALAECQMVPKDIPWTECPFFQGLSSKEVRLARLEKKTNRYTEQFDVLKSKLLPFAAFGVNAHLKSATELLCQIQERVFDFFLSYDFKEDRIPAQNELFDKLEVKELQYVNKMRNYVSKNQSKFATIVANAIRSYGEIIVIEAGQMQFDAIKIGDVVGRNEVVEQCRRQIKDMVLFKIMNIAMDGVRKAVSSITKMLRESLESEFNEVTRDEDRLFNLVKQQLEYSFLQHFQDGNACVHFDYALMKFGVKLIDDAKKVVGDVWSAITGKGTTLNEQWKRNIAKSVLENVDCDAIAVRICFNILSDVESGHKLFQANLAYMRLFCQDAAAQTDVQRKFASACSPFFARLMCKAKALYQSLACEVPWKAAFGARVGRKGHRGQVFEDKSNKLRVIKQLTCNEAKQDEHLLGITKTSRRIQEDISTILKPVSLILDGSNEVTVLFPRMNTDLFERLQSGQENPIKLVQGLKIVQQMIDALENCWIRGIHHVDLRITNVLLDVELNAKLNVSKPRDDSIPYPDNLAPFHVPRGNPGACKVDPDTVSTLQTHCAYSLAVLLLLLLGEKYDRPAYAQTSNVNEVYTAINQAKDSDHVSRWKDPGVRHSGGKVKALKIVHTMFNAQRQEGILMSLMDNFKLQVAEMLSYYEVYEVTSL
ncbi:dual serine/threonine and tyrosine protein kinase-like isoform X2 [Orbicella faveolata]|uniref:dual serine/threonine and tyrosine protein kinase-like isoform X2 n=1 Tax=Orbicella faveolata TaxID=48498 RepID=UPI0009E535AE|nr:dual serine/threonine and tyrosine protein kinase-like isoform X2 [Orbicella faveolata]